MAQRDLQKIAQNFWNIYQEYLYYLHKYTKIDIFSLLEQNEVVKSSKIFVKYLTPKLFPTFCYQLAAQCSKLGYKLCKKNNNEMNSVWKNKYDSTLSINIFYRLKVLLSPY